MDQDLLRTYGTLRVERWLFFSTHIWFPAKEGQALTEPSRRDVILVDKGLTFKVKSRMGRYKFLPDNSEKN